MTIETHAIESSRNRVVVLANRSAGPGGDRAKYLKDFSIELEKRGLICEVCHAPDEFIERVQQPAVVDSLRCVVAAGGDGTAELVANSTSPDTPIVVFPMGTENLLAKYLRHTREPVEMASCIERGLCAVLDAGQVEGKLFLVMLSCGFDADVVHRLHNERTGNINHFSYAKPIFDSIRTYEYPELTITYWNDQSDKVQFKSHWAFVFNVPSYAAGLDICSEANPFDQQLDLATFAGGSFWHGMYHLSAVMLGQHKNITEFKSTRATRLRIESTKKVPYQVDGDPGGFLPIEIEILPRRLKVIVSDTWLARTESQRLQRETNS